MSEIPTDAPCTDCGVRSEAGNCLCNSTVEGLSRRLDRLERLYLPIRPPHPKWEHMFASPMPCEPWKGPSESGIHICQSCGRWRGFEDGPFSSFRCQSYCDRCLHVAQQITIDQLLTDVDELTRALWAVTAQVNKLKKKVAKK